MAFNFIQAVNRMQNGHPMTRPNWIDNQYIMIHFNMSYVYLMSPNNIFNPTSPYSCKIEDVLANDWIDKV